MLGALKFAQKEAFWCIYFTLPCAQILNLLDIFDTRNFLMHFTFMNSSSRHPWLKFAQENFWCIFTSWTQILKILEICTRNFLMHFYLLELEFSTSLQFAQENSWCILPSCTQILINIHKLNWNFARPLRFHRTAVYVCIYRGSSTHFLLCDGELNISHPNLKQRPKKAAFDNV
jgi:hypothetical protein